MVDETNVMSLNSRQHNTATAGKGCPSPSQAPIVFPTVLSIWLSSPAYKDGACTCYGPKKDKGEKIEDHVFENTVLELTTAAYLALYKTDHMDLANCTGV